MKKKLHVRLMYVVILLLLILYFFTPLLNDKATYIAILLVPISIIRDIGTKNAISKYKKLTDQEKKIYDISKVKLSELLYAISLIILAILAYIFTEIFPDIISTNIFIWCFLIEIVVLLIFSQTKWILNLFCKKTEWTYFLLSRFIQLFYFLYLI